MLSTSLDRAAGTSPWRRLGKIKLGIKAKNNLGVEYPQDVDYFVVPEQFRKALGEKPKELKLILAHKTLEENFTTKAAMYQANGSRACWTVDDKKAHRFMDPVTPGGTKKKWCEIECPAMGCEFRKAKKCQERGYFSFMLPATGQIGTFALIFGSTVGITRILTALQTLELLCQARPQGLAGIRMVMRREPVDFYKDLKGTGELAKITKHIPTLEIDFASLLAADHNLLAPFFGQPLVALPADVQVLDGDLEAEGDDDKDPEEGKP